MQEITKLRIKKRLRNFFIDSRWISFLAMMVIFAIIGLILNHYIDYPNFFLYWEIMAIIYSTFGALVLAPAIDYHNYINPHI